MRATEHSLSARAKGTAASLALALGLGAALLAGLRCRARALDGATARLSLEAPRELRVGERAHIDLIVALPPGAAEPLLLTPYREGEALDVVKGRLLRSDARDPAGKSLRFELPVVAAAPGTALIGVRLLAYVCAPRCRAIEAEARVNVVVLPR